MHIFRTTSLLVLTSLALSACGSSLSDSNYTSPGKPEALLSATSERVNVSIEDRESLLALADWVEADEPTRAEVSCMDDDACQAIRTALAPYNIQGQKVGDDKNNVALIYERVVARPCHNSYISNHVNPYNLNHPAFGCSTAMNSVQMVSDYRQFVEPEKVSDLDAEMAVKNVRRYEGIDDPYYPY